MSANVSLGTRWCTAIALTGFCTFSCAAGSPGASALPSVLAFFRNADILDAKLSPSGRWLAVTTSTKTSRVFLAVVDMADGAVKAAPKVLAAYSSVDVNSFDWVNEERLVFNTIDTAAPLNDQDFGPGLFSINRDGGGVRMLIRPLFTPFVSENSRMLTQPLEPNHALMTVLRDGSDDVIVGEYYGDATGYVDAIAPKRLNVTTGRTTIATGAPAHAKEWVFDRRGEARVAVTTSNGRSGVFMRESRDAPWKRIAESSSIRMTIDPLFVDEEDRLYVAAASKGMSVLKRFDATTGKVEPEAMISAAGFDIAPRPIVDGDTSRLLGVRYLTDAEATTWFDPSMSALQKVADARFPGRSNRLTCRRCTTDGVLMVFSFSDQDPGSYWLYRAASKSWESIGRRRNDIEPASMAQLDLFRIKARDGEDLPVWVTMPQCKADKPRAAVALVHGGPWVRGATWQWNADAQFLASRGYVVIEPEFRGGTGYGIAHLEKGFKQWGLKMQDDVADAVQWAATKGLIDPSKVCIAGASYGGYATLMGLVRQPDLYKCGVAWVAVTDPRLLFDNSWLSDMPREAREFSLPVMVGDPVADAVLLKEAAPVEHAKEIRAPLLMAFGGKDVRVPLEHGTSMQKAMESAGQHPEFVVYDGEGHGFLKVENRVDFYTRVEKFLAKNLQ